MDRLQGNGLQVGQGNVVEIFIFDLDKATGELHCQHQVNAECCNVAHFMCQLSITVNKRYFYHSGKYDGGMAWWPPYKDSYKILQSVLKRTSPDPSKGWKQYSCRILHETKKKEGGGLRCSDVTHCTFYVDVVI